jgi:hypothetical protein
VRALGQRSSEFGEVAKDDATMPLGLREIGTTPLVLVRGPGSKRESGKGYAMATSDEEIMVAFSSRVQDLLRQC